MPLSKSGRIVIVDDNYSQVEPLMEALGVKGTPYLYYNGKVKTLPKKPIEGIRFVFLDIELHGMAGQDDKTKASGLVSVLKKLVGMSNGPYVIIFWTTHHNVIKQVLDNCESKGIPPVAWIDLEKGGCLTDGDSIKKITEALDTKLKGIGAFQLYTEWENLIHSSGSEVVAELSNIAKEETGTKWSEKTASLFFTLYKNYVDKNTTDDNEEKFRLSCHLLNRNFSGILESNTALSLKLPDGLKINQAIALSQMEKSRLNKALFIGDSLSSKPSTGDVYFEEDPSILKALEKALKFKTVLNQPRLCKVVLTAECDIAQNKLLHLDGTPLHRIVYGVVCLEENKDRHESRYRVGPIFHEEKILYLYFIFGSMGYHKESSFQSSSLFTLKRDLCFDLQSKAANHVNRLGEYQFI